MKRIVLVLMMLSSFLVRAQYEAEKFEAALLEAKFGALLVYNGRVNSFSLRFAAKSVVPTDQPNFVLIDNMLMQASIIPFVEKLNFKDLDNQKQKMLLKNWKAYEKNWVEEQLKTKVVDREEVVTISGKTFLYWTYTMPKSNDKDSVDKQVYLVTICFDQILLLNGPVQKGKKEETIKEKFFTIAKTLTLYPGKTQDIEKLYYSLKK